MPDGKAALNRIYSTFSDVASSLGYSPVHGKIIASLLVRGEPLSLQKLAKETGYSASMVSLSLDLLEVLGVIKKVKKTADRKLYIELHGDLLEVMKNALLIKIKKSIDSSLKDFEARKKELETLKPKEREQPLRVLNKLEKEIKRLERYVNLLSSIKLP